MLHEFLSPTKSADGSTALFSYPLGTGALPFIHLDDFARYTATILSRPSEFAGRELHVATVHASGPGIAEAFTTVTGQPAQYVDVPLDTWLSKAFVYQPRGANLPVGRVAYPEDMTVGKERFFLPQTVGENFSAWWNVYNHSGDNNGIIRRDYQMLDAVLPDRVKTLEEWMRKVDYDGGRRELLKGLNDRLAAAKVKGSAQARGSAWG